MNTLKFGLLALLVCAFLLPSCTIQKRVYQKGFHVEWKQNNMKSDKVSVTTDTPADPVIDSQIADEPQQSQVESIGSADVLSVNSEMAQLAINDPAKITRTPDDECDIITLKTGEEISGKVQEITETAVKYKRCDNLKGPTITLSKTKVLMVKYPNGTKDVINEAPAEKAAGAEDVVDTSNAKTDAFAVLSLVGALIGFGILGMLFGLIALHRIRTHPEKYKGRGLAWAGYIIGLIIVIIVIVVLVAV